jgi:hydrogenase small subunit
VGVATITTEGVLSVVKPEKAAASSTVEIPVIWLAAGACTGCAVSFLNGRNPRVQDVLVQEVIPGYHVSLRFHETVMAAEGEVAMAALEEALEEPIFVLMAEGGFSTKDDGVYCKIGEIDGQEMTALAALKEAAGKAAAVLNIGTCSSFGGIPAAKPNPTDIKPVPDILKEAGITTPVVNVPGCPPHPDWIVGTVAQVLISLDLTADPPFSVEVDEDGRPKAFYGSPIHDNCPRRGYFDRGKFALKPSDPYCLYELGCKGPITNSDCPIRQWNSGTNWCIGCGHPCIGCVEPGFPDDTGPIYVRTSALEASSAGDAVEWIGLGVGAAAVAGVGAHLVGSAAAGRLKKEEEGGGDDK